MRLLLVEDDSLLGDGIRAGLQQSGFVVDWVKDGQAAKLALEAEAYALVGLDLGLPRLDGWAVIRELRHDESTRATPIVVLTALDYPSAIEPAMADGCDAITTKPCNPATLVAMVRGLLARTYEARARRDS